ncbi:MAG: hypothetical protein N3G80_03470, partial [Candidatus Micrarchaeota archaeon]|nr:hypothetical protein [Candidatus Micrarchaeota archaeon]
MVAFSFDPLYHSLLVFLSAIVPGVALGFPLLKKSSLSFTEKLFASFFIGLFAVPTLLFLEGLAGIQFSFFLTILNIFLLTAAGVFWGIKTDAFFLPKLELHQSLEFAKKAAPSFLLVLACLWAFWIRIQPYSPIYSELDPYWYVYSTAQLIQYGAVPPTDDTAWYPEVKSSHRSVPLKAYLEAQWYSLYTAGGAFDNYLLFTTSSWLPPISAALLCFGAYLLISCAYGRRYGLLAAFLTALLPATIFKMSAGVNEASPVGFMMLFLSLGMFAWSIYRKDSALLPVASYAFFVAVLASNIQIVLILPLAGIFLLQAVDYFVRGKQNLDFLKEGAIVLAGFLLGSILLGIYLQFPLFGIFNSKILALLASYFLLILSFFALKQNKFQQNERFLAVGIGILAAVAILLSPLGAAIRNEIKDYVSAAQFNHPLDKTIAEQNRAGSDFESEAGFIALVPKNHIKPGGDFIANSFFNILQFISSVFSSLGNGLIGLADFAFRILVNKTEYTDKKADSLFFVFLLVGSFALAVRHFRREPHERELPSVFILILLFTLPILYVGINKIKFTIYATLSIAVLAAVSVAELERLVIWIGKRLKSSTMLQHTYSAFIVVIALLVFAQATFPFAYGKIILLKSFEPRYQDDPVGVAPKAAALCEQLRARGVSFEQIRTLCLAGADPKFASTINNQFDFDVCWLSQMTIDELLPSNPEEQKAASEAAFSARFRCNRIASYWIEAMEWIKSNLDEDDRVTSWWDYGHWTNYLGQKKTVLRNEHTSTAMIGRVAHDFIIGSTQDLIDSMNYFDSRYVLFDIELIGGLGSAFGGKYGALNYLGCVHEGLATLEGGPGSSDCEFEHSPERIIIPKGQPASSACVISESQQIKGLVAYPIKRTGPDLSSPRYCVGEATIKTGEKIAATYYLDRKDEDGNLVLSKGFLRIIDDQPQYVMAELVYNNLPVWPGPNGTWVDG